MSRLESNAMPFNSSSTFWLMTMSGAWAEQSAGVLLKGMR
jgi:hypothetical protein